MTSHLEACAADARVTLGAWHAPDAQQSAMRDRFLSFLDAHGARSADRDLRAGHLTGSAILLDQSRTHVLLTLHALIGQWVQLGGHVEPGDRSMAEAAGREVLEESGIAGAVLDPVPIGLDWHPIRCRDSRGERSPSQHLDITYVAVAPGGAEHVRSDESLDLDWFPIDALPDGADDTLRRLIARVRALGHA